jgi:predicted enzyme related to lactoylglutathione lyase
MPTHEQINYLEFPARDLQATRTFFETAFGWRFTDYGPDYLAFDGAGVDGGFYRAEACARSASGSVLVVLYSTDLAQTQARIEAAGGRIVKPIFAFPGGRRFHFTEPSGNELAVWSDT